MGKKLGITKREVEDLISNPEQIIPGDMDILVAQRMTRNGLLRSPFIDGGVYRKIITVYWTSKIEKYWREEKDEDKI